MRQYITVIGALLLSACATQPQYVWVKSGAGQQEFSQDSGQCRAQAFSVPLIPLSQALLIFESCLQGKGWHQVPG